MWTGCCTPATTHFISQAGSAIAGVSDLKGKSFAIGSRGSVQAGLLAYHYLKQEGINPNLDLSRYSFYNERTGGPKSDEVDVFERWVSSALLGAGPSSARSTLVERVGSRKASMFPPSR